MAAFRLCYEQVYKTFFIPSVTFLLHLQTILNTLKIWNAGNVYQN